MSAEPVNQAPTPAARADFSKTWPYFWSVRRELWEYRSIYIAPLVAAGVVLFGHLLGTAQLRLSMHAISAMPPAHQRGLLALPYIVAHAVVMATAFIVALFYCLGALHNERRDRSILFWKSLPVSDLTTVLAKASIPLFVIPLTVFPIVVATQLAMRGLSVPLMALRGLSAGSNAVSLINIWAVLLYTLIVLPLWYAPIWAWLLLVSGWSRRVAFLWAVLPPVALCVIEKIAFDTSFFASVLFDRLAGGIDEAIDGGTRKGEMIDLSQLDPAKFLSSPGLWLGLAVAAAFLGAAVWLRRYRDPI